VDRYRQNFGADRVIVFDKKAEADLCDEGNNFDERRTITMARNACFTIAEQLGVTHFVELDDDYVCFELRFLNQDESKLMCMKMHHLPSQDKPLDRLLSIYLRFFVSTPFTSIAFAQGGDFIGGAGNPKVRRLLSRKAMNSFFCSTQRPFRFVGAMNEDVNTYTTLGSRGMLFGTVNIASVIQTATQSSSGGITAMYERFGTYCKGFSTVMMMPSSVHVAMMQSNHSRLHHSINWSCCVPCIVPERYRKP
jgi:hypothetical protein